MLEGQFELLVPHVRVHRTDVWPPPRPPADVGESDQAIPLPNVSANVLKKVLEWCEHHKKDPEPLAEDQDDSRRKTTEISDWDAKFIQVDQEMLFEIILAANYLDIKPLLSVPLLAWGLSVYTDMTSARSDVGCKTVANMIKGKQPEEIRKLYVACTSLLATTSPSTR